MKKTLLNTVFILLAGGILGTVLLAVVFCIPVDRMLEGYQAEGLESINRRDGWHRYIVDYEASTLDNNTEWLMIKAAATPLPDTGENIVQKALRCYTLNSEWNHGLTFQTYEWKGQTYSCDSYERYWHGYVVFLKPLLYFLSYTDLVFLNIGMQMMLLFLIEYMFLKKGMKQLCMPFMIFWILTMQIIIMLCLDYSVCFYIYAISVLVLLIKPEVKRYHLYFFLIIGMITSYMDLLTWPLVTLGVPLLVILQIKDEKKSDIKVVVGSTIFWGIGYVGQWALKWIISSLMLSDNVILDALNQLLIRSSLKVNDSASQITWYNAIIRNIQVFAKKGYLVVFIAVMVWLLYLMLMKYKRLNWKNILPYLFISVYPFLWYIATANHVYIHGWMTWRVLAISVLAFIIGVIDMGDKAYILSGCENEK